MRTLVAALFLAFALPTSGMAATVAIGSTQADDSGGILPAAGSSTGVLGADLSSETTTPDSDWVWYADGGIVATYTFNFDLTGYDVNTAALSGLYGARDYVQVTLNGLAIDVLPLGGANAAALSAYGTSNASQFNAGANSLTFVAIDLTGNGAFRATATVTADLAAIPLPASGLVLLIGCAGLAFVRRRQT